MKVGKLLWFGLAAATILGGCVNGSSLGTGTGGQGGGAGATGGDTGSSTGGAPSGGSTGGDTGTAGQSGDTGGAPGTGGATAQGGASGTPGTGGATAQGGASGTPGTGGVSAGGAGGGATAGAGAGGDTGDPPAPRPINIKPGGGCNCSVNGITDGQQLIVDTRKPIQGKLVLVLGGICGGPGGGGIEGYAQNAGFHVWKPATQTCVNSAPQKYKDIIAKTPLDPDANRQVGDARMELWDGVDRVDWVTVAPGTSIVERTEAALKTGAMNDQGGDWGYFLDANGHVRWTDVYVVGYSWGSQTLAMVSSYVRFGRVFTTSGPQAEGFPNATWITHPSATPNDRKYMAVGFNLPYPSMDKLDTAPNTVTSMIMTTIAAGWGDGAAVMNVKPGDVGPFAPAHLFAMVGSNPHSPGGHTIFCTDDPMNGWAALCLYAFGLK